MKGSCNGTKDFLVTCGLVVDKKLFVPAVYSTSLKKHQLSVFPWSAKKQKNEASFIMIM